MNEPKRRGRLPKVAAIEAQAPNSVPYINGNEQGQHDRVMVEQSPVIAVGFEGIPADKVSEIAEKTVNVRLDMAQAYALRVWSGQSESLGRGERIARIKAALEGQGLSFDGVKLPGDESADDDWTEEDEKPLTWRKASA